MKRFYFPKNIYDALKQNPDLPIKDIQHITNCARSTAYRYKSNYNFCIKNPEIVLIDHTINRVDIKTWKKRNEQQEHLNQFLSISLNTHGFESSPDLRNQFYAKHPMYSSQSNQNFNRYFKRFRDEVNMSQYKLKIMNSILKPIGFYTVNNPNYSPKD